MNTQTISDEIDKLADKAQALVSATADAAGEEVVEARKRLATALERGKEIYARVRTNEIAGACAVRKAVNEHAFEAIALSLGIGALIGYLSTRRCAAKCE